MSNTQPDPNFTDGNELQIDIWHWLATASGPGWNVIQGTGGLPPKKAYITA